MRLSAFVTYVAPETSEYVDGDVEDDNELLSEPRLIPESSSSMARGLGSGEDIDFLLLPPAP